MPLASKPIAFCILMATMGISSGCGFAVARFNAEARSVASEAQKKFPPGADAKAFETWFAAKGGQEASGLFGKKVHQASCEPKAMVVTRAQGCMNHHVARYCVNASGKIEYLTFETSGYC